MLTVLLLCVMCTGILPVHGQTSSGPLLLFGITRNSENGRTTLWRFDIAVNRATALLRLGAVNPATPRELFPESERTALDAAVARGVYTRGDSDTPGVSQGIARVWQLDAFTLLVLQKFEVCQRPMSGCYGNYRFGLFDMASEELTKLLDYPYTHSDTETWDGCMESLGVWIEVVLPNPQRSLIAFTVRPRVRCINERDSLAYLLDFESASPTVTRIPDADYLSWSPDGARLAYITRGACDNRLCEMAVRVRDMESGEISSIETGSPYINAALFTAWTDDVTVFYQWRDRSSGGDVPPDLVWHNLLTRTVRRELALPFFSGHVYYLNDGQQTNMIGILPGFMAAGFATSPGLAITAEFSDAGLFTYNSRSPGYVLFNVNMAEHRVDYIDASLARGTVNLAGMVPENEWLGDLSVGLR